MVPAALAGKTSGAGLQGFNPFRYKVARPANRRSSTTSISIRIGESIGCWSIIHTNGMSTMQVSRPASSTLSPSQCLCAGERMVREQGTSERAVEEEERALPSATPPPRQEERQDETSGSEGEGSPPPRRSMAEVYDLSDGEESCSPSVSVDGRSHGGTPSRRTRGGSR